MGRLLEHHRRHGRHHNEASSIGPSSRNRSDAFCKRNWTAQGREGIIHHLVDVAKINKMTEGGSFQGGTNGYSNHYNETQKVDTVHIL